MGIDTAAGQPPPTPSRFSITTRRPVAILMVVMAVCVFGWVSYERLSLSLMPDIAYPTLTVRTQYPGTAPEEVENQISRRLEQELGILPHLATISSISKAGQSDIILEFEWDTDMNASSADIREKVDRTNLPEEAEKPLLLRYDPSLDPILRLGLHGPQTLYSLRELAEREIKRELESIAGIAAVKVKGGLEEQIQVSISEQQMTLLGLDISTVNARLNQANVNLPGGQLREGQTEYLVRTLNEFQSLAQIADLIVADVNGAAIRLRDIGEVTRSHREREIITRVNGRESVELEVYKEADANIVAVARAVRNRLFGLPQQRAYVEDQQQKAERAAAAASDSTGQGEEALEDEADEAAVEADDGEGDAEQDLKARKREEAIRIREHLRMTDFISHNLPEGAQLEVLSDQSIFIENSIQEVRTSALIGGAMAILVLFVFLRNVLHTLIIGITIPVSIVATFAPMFLFDVSLNIMSLGGLALGIGMLVDNSIVVLESIFRCREEGDDLLTATVRGTAEVGSAVFASTLTTIAVFFPIVFVEGIAGQVFGDMALTVVFSLLASLLVALYFIPMLASRRLEADGGGLAGQLKASDFLRLGAVSRLSRCLSGEGELTAGARLREAALVIPTLVVELLTRILQAAATLVGAAGKGVAVILFEVLWPLLKLVERLWVRPQRTFHASFGEWAAGAPTGGWWSFFDKVWPGILGFGATAALAADAAASCRWIRGSRTAGWLRFAWRGLRSLVFPVLFLFLCIRFLFHALLRLVGTVLHTAIMLVVLAVIGVGVLVTLVAIPVCAPVLFLFQHGFGAVQQVYPTVLRWALANSWVVIGGALASFWLCWTQLVPSLGSELIPQVHQGEFNLEVRLPVGTPLARTAHVVRAIEEMVVGQPEVDRVSTTVGTDKTATSSSQEGEHTAKITIKMMPGSRAEAEEVLIQYLRQRLGDLPELEAEVSYPTLFSFKTPVEVEIRGHDLRDLRQLSAEAASRISEIPGLADVRSSLQVGNPELQVIYNRDRLAAFGLNLRAVAELIRNKVQGRVATDFRREERNIDILVRLREDDRLGVAELGRLVVNPQGDAPITLASVAEIRIAEGPSEIRRINQQRAALVTANIHGIDLGSASARIEDVLNAMAFPAGFSFFIGGQNREMETSQKSMIFALGLAVFLVYIVMASQFESLVHPFVIMFTVPLALVGVIAVLSYQQVPLSIVVFIGLIMLAGIVVNNAIVLVDYINTLRRGGMEKMEAIVQAGSVRLRPISMTTLTTVLALLPMAVGLGEGSEIRTPMALTVIAGLTSSTFLTLVVIPTVYSVVDRSRQAGDRQSA
jgi:HAE1 family hydrophobic/amphiphilic exporter-1